MGTDRVYSDINRLHLGIEGVKPGTDTGHEDRVQMGENRVHII